MFSVVQNSTRKVKLTYNNSLGYFLIKFVNPFNNDIVFSIFENKGSALKPIIEVVDTGDVAPDPLAGEVRLNVLGNWNAFIYKQASSSNLNIANATFITETIVFVQGDAKCVTPPRNSDVIKTCQDVKDCIGISDSGNASYFLNEQGDFLLISAGDIAGLIQAGTNVTITGSGTIADPYVINSSGGGGGGTVTSVGLTMPSAFNVANSPITGAGTLAVTGAGTASQYIRGDGVLATLPTNGGGGGARVNYYLNGSVNQGTFGGSTYYELNKTAVIGAGTNFNRNTDGLIAQFITDANDPSQLLIPSGNWNFELYFSASSSGGSPSFYVELLKYSGTTFTLIASSQSSAEGITNGTTKDSYFTPLAVPETVLLATDRLAIRVYITASGRTITLHTEDNNLCQVITTFTTGLTALNGLTKQVQYFAVGNSGTDFVINSATDTHTFNLPTASSSNRGALSSADWTIFNGKLTPNAPITAATKTKITYDANGLVTAGADLSASDLPTGIDATKIGDGSVSNTEFQYLDGATRNIQTQINNISQADEIEFAMVASFKSLYNF